MIPAFFAAGSAGGFTIVATATIYSEVYSKLTPKGKVEALRKLYEEVKERHDNFVRETLPNLLPAHSGNPQFQDAQVVYDMLKGHRRTLDEIKGTVSSAGVYGFSPMFKRKELADLERDLKFLDVSTLSTTKTANRILDEPHKKKCAQYVEKHGGYSMEYQIAPASSLQRLFGWESDRNVSSDKSVTQ